MGAIISDSSKLKLAASNLAWDLTWDDEVLRFMVDTGFGGVEVAPTKLWGSWPDIETQDVVAYRKKINDYGLQIPAFQSILYGVSLSLLDTANILALSEHFKRLCEIADAAETNVLIVGSPGLRRLRTLSYSSARAQAVDVFGALGRMAEPYGISLGLECNPPEYGCDFLTTQAETASFVAEVGHPCVREHLDLGALIVNGDESVASHMSRQPAHVHVSTPGLASLSTKERELRTFFSKMPDRIDCWVSAEILNLEALDSVCDDLKLLASLAQDKVAM